MTSIQLSAFIILVLTVAISIPAFAISHDVMPTIRWIAIYTASEFVIIASSLAIYFWA